MTDEQKLKLDALQVRINDFQRLFDLNSEKITSIESKLNPIKEQSKTLKSNIEKIRLEQFEITDGESVKTEFYEFSQSSSESVDVYNDSDLPKQYYTTTIKPDKVAIKKAIKAGEDVSGACIDTKYKTKVKEL